MLALALVIAAATLGWGLVRRLGWALSRLEAWALAGAVALTATPWLLLAMAWGLGFEAGMPAAIALMLVGGLALGRGPARAPTALPATSALSWVALGGLLALLFHGHMLHREGGGLYTGGATFGDLALHATLANHFAHGPVELTSPIVSGTRLTYPFLGDFLVACLVRGGWSLSTAFAVSGWLTAMVFLALVQAVAVRLWRSAAAATIAAWLVVLSGSAIGLVLAIEDAARRGLPGDWAALPSYANDRGRGLVWSNLVADFLLPQRALLAALPAAWAAVWALRASVEDDAPRARVVAAIAIGLLPFLHAHSFLVMIGVLLCTAAVESLRTPRRAGAWAAAVGLALGIAAPQLAWQFGGSWHAHFGHWQLGWLAPRGGFWWFWVRAWGVALLALPLALAIAWRARRRGFATPLALSALGLFVAANLYQFQPHDWDNMKFFVYAFMFAVVLAAGHLARALRGGRVARVVAAAGLLVATATGALTLARELDLHDQLASRDDLRQARALERVLPARALVLTSDQHNHVVPMLTGRSIVMGYRGWLWTHGIDYRAREQAVARMFAGGVGAERLLRRFGVTHVYIGPGERAAFHADEDWYRARFRQVAAFPGVVVFDVRTPLASAIARR